MGTCVRASGSRYYLMLADGEPADPAMFVVNEPPGRWRVGDTFFTGNGARFRILDIQAASEEPNGTPWAGEANGVWTVGPV
jgi:hypothetical protein